MNKRRYAAGAGRFCRFRFKHAIVQEVIYKSLLKPDRRSIHKRVARTMETLFHDRPESVLETLALHYANSDCTYKAAEYLIRSGEKSLEKYAVEESLVYYESAYRLPNRIAAPTADELAMLIDLIINWYFAFNKRGLFIEMLDLLRTLPMASRLAERYLLEAIEIGTQIVTRLRLARACLDLGLLYGHKKRFNDAREYIARSIDLFDRCGADMLIVDARAALDDLPR